MPQHRSAARPPVSMSACTLSIAALLLALSGPVLAQTPPPPKVIVAEAALTEVGASASFNGRAVAVQKVDIRARVAGFLIEKGFAEGARVEAGSVLFRIDDAAYRAVLAQADASVAAAQAALQLAEIELARQAELLDRKTAPQALVDRARADAAKAAAEVARLLAVRDAAALDLSYTVITAPFAGQVGLSSADVGALIGPDSGPLLTLVLNDPISVEFPVPERTLLQTRASGGADSIDISLRLSDRTVFPAEGKINFADVAVSQATDTVMIRAQFPNPDGLLRDGSLVSVTLDGAAAAPELAIPQQAVQRDVTGEFVLVVDAAGLVARKPVSINRLSQGLAVIDSGLSAGERVITGGINKARPGAVVDAALAGEN